MKAFRSAWFFNAVILLAAAAWKGWLLLWGVVPFNSDEAVVALMARHILQGERPVFFYGQAYMGSLDAFLVAGSFWVFGQQVWVVRLVQVLLYLGVLWTTAQIGKVAFGSRAVGWIAAALLAIPTVNVTLYTTASLGGYGEALLIGNVLLLLSFELVRPAARFRGWGWGLWGGLAGLGLWANGLTLVYTIPCAVYVIFCLARRGWRSVGGFTAAAGVGFLVGALPWWAYAAAHGPQALLTELLGKAVAVEQVTWLARTADHLVNFLLLGLTVIFGMRPPWAVTWLVLPLLPLILFFWVAVIIFWARQAAWPGAHRGAYLLLAGVAGVLLAGFLFTPFGVDPSGRYFLPLAVPLALTAAQAIHTIALRPGSRWPWLAAGLVMVVIVYQGGGTLQSARRDPPGLTTQFYAPTIVDHRADGKLVNFLHEQGETRGYTTYWVAYPLAFESAETLIFVPRLPYHLDLRYTPRDDRYPPYTALVAASPQTAYITAGNAPLDTYLRAQFQMLGVTWREQVINDYRVYYHLSRGVQPTEIHLGETRE